MIDKFSHFRTLHLAHFLFCLNSLNTHHKEELQQQQQQLQLQLASSFAFYMRNNNKTRRAREKRASTRERNSLGEATVYVMYFIVVFFRFSPLLSRRVRRCARGKS